MVSISESPEVQIELDVHNENKVYYKYLNTITTIEVYGFKWEIKF